MNGKGQVIFFTLMMAVVIIVLAIAFTFPVNQAVNNARNATIGDTIGLDCDAPASEFTEGTCVIVDLFTPYFIGALLAIAGTIIGAKLIIGVGNE